MSRWKMIQEEKTWGIILAIVLFVIQCVALWQLNKLSVDPIAAP